MFQWQQKHSCEEIIEKETPTILISSDYEGKSFKECIISYFGHEGIILDELPIFQDCISFKENIIKSVNGTHVGAIYVQGKNETHLMNGPIHFRVMLLDSDYKVRESFSGTYATDKYAKERIGMWLKETFPQVK